MSYISDFNDLQKDTDRPYYQKSTKLSEVFGSPTRSLVQPSKDDMLLTTVKTFQKNFSDHTQPLLYMIEKHLKNINNILVYNYPLTTFIQIELDSSHRNRKEFPLQSDFIIPFTNGAIGTNYLNSIDPVFDGIPFYWDTCSAVGTKSTVKLASNASTLDNFYINNWITVTNTVNNIKVYRKIIQYDGTNQTATVDPEFPDNTNGDYFIKRELHILNGTITVVSLTPNYCKIQLPASGTSAINKYIGMYIYFLTGTSQGKFAQIKSYNFVTNEIEIYTLQDVDGKFNAIQPGDLATGDNFEIDSFSYDNFYPLRYTGTRTNQAVCYAIAITQLSIPRKTLKVGYGGFVSDYPYVFVHFYNHNRHSQTIMYGNSPAANIAVFKVPLSLTSTTPNFIVAQNINVTTPQVIKFNPGESYSFKVTLPNGEVLQFQENDNFSPLPPNPLLQIGAMFAVQRMPVPVKEE